ncbi:unnamed protein product [Gadus morhua 'NCC']
MVGLWRLMEQEEHDEGTFPSAVCQPEIGLYLPVSRHKDQLSPTPSSASSPVTVVSWTLVGVHAPPLEDARKHQGDGCPRVYQGQVAGSRARTPAEPNAN